MMKTYLDCERDESILAQYVLYSGYEMKLYKFTSAFCRILSMLRKFTWTKSVQILYNWLTLLKKHDTFQQYSLGMK